MIQLRTAYQMATRLIALPMLVSLLLLSCSNKEKMSSSTNLLSSSAMHQVPGDFKMTMGMGGLPGGRLMGYSIDASGSLRQWEGKYPEENIQREATMASDQVNELWRQLVDSQYFEMERQSGGAAGTFMNVVANGEVHRISWSNPLGTKPQATEWQQLYDDCMEMVQQTLSGIQ